jgi:phosphoribosylanthranilate isomerase
VNFKIKICGLTSVADALAAIDAGADAIGLNFYRGSQRCVDVDTARQIVDAVGNRADKIGVFVNESADRIRETCHGAGLHLIQLHGDEPPEFLRLLNKDHDIVRAYRLGERGLSAIDDDLQACSDLSGFCPDAILVDASVPGKFGGTGQTIDWQQLANHRDTLLGSLPLILAGGLVPTNVAEAIRVVRPQAVDTASGVEFEPGKKDAAKVRDFVAAARAAFAAL